MSVPFSLINFTAYLKGHIPNILQAAASILFIAIWFLLGFMSNSRQKKFIKISSIFWLGGALLLFVGYSVNMDLIYIAVAFLISGPSYGIRYFWNVPSDINFAFASAMISYIFSLIGLLVGNVLKLSKKNNLE